MVVLAVVLTFGMAAAIELFHRAEVVHWVGRAPDHWSAPNVQAFSTATSLALGQNGRADVWWTRAASATDADPYIAAEACHRLSTTSARNERGTEGLRQAREAVAVAPDDAVRLPVYYRDLVRRLRASGAEAELVSVLRQGVSRAGTRPQQAELLAGCINELSKPRWAQQALDVHAEYAASHPGVTADERVRQARANALRAAGQRDAALRAFEELAQGAESPRIRSAATHSLAELQAERPRDGH